MPAVATTTPGPTILVIEDDPPLQRFLRVTLETQDYKVIVAGSGEEGLRQAAATAQPDIVILDLGLPDMDGLDVARRLREWTAVPVIVVTARGKELDKVEALDAGADDYLTKPFGVGELLARVRVALRHRAAAAKAPAIEPEFKVGGLHVDLARREVTADGKSVRLTPHEFKLLSVLVKNAGRVVTHQQLLREVWGPGTGNETHYVRVYVNQLRQKLEVSSARPKYILTEPGVGYRLLDER